MSHSIGYEGTIDAGNSHYEPIIQKCVIVGSGSDMKNSQDSTIIGADSFINGGNNCHVIGPNIRLNSQEHNTKNAVYIGNLNDSIYLFTNSELYESFALIQERYNKICKSIERSNDALYMQIYNDKYVNIKETIVNFENRLNYLEHILHYIQKKLKKNEYE